MTTPKEAIERLEVLDDCLTLEEAYPENPKANSMDLLCIGAWVHMGRCNGFWWFDNLQRRRSSEPRIVGDGVRTWPLEDDEMYDWDDFDDSYPPACSSPKGHRWVCRDDDEEISYCANCGADGNA